MVDSKVESRINDVALVSSSSSRQKQEATAAATGVPNLSPILEIWPGSSNLASMPAQQLPGQQRPAYHRSPVATRAEFRNSMPNGLIPLVAMPQMTPNRPPFINQRSNHSTDNHPNTFNNSR